MSYLIDVTNVTNREVENFPKMLELPANTVVGQVASFDSFVFAYNGSKWIMLSNQEETPALIAGALLLSSSLAFGALTYDDNKYITAYNKEIYH